MKEKLSYEGEISDSKGGEYEGDYTDDGGRKQL
jgi:hypothetical protein